MDKGAGELEVQCPAGRDLIARTKGRGVAHAGARVPTAAAQVAEKEHGPRVQQDVAEGRVGRVVADLGGKLDGWNVGNERSDDHPPSNVPTFKPSTHQLLSLRSRPVISRGCSMS